MALITCPECNGQVSDKAAVCPHCGYPIAANNTQEQYAFCVKSQPIPKSAVQEWERFTAIRLTMEIAGVSTATAKNLLDTPNSIIKDKLTEQEAAAVVLNYQKLHIPTAVEQSNYTLREVEQEKQEAQEAFLKKRAAENPDELFVFKKLWPGMVDLACAMCGQKFSTDINRVSVVNDLVIEVKRPITCTKCHRVAYPGTKIAKNVGFFTPKDPDSAAIDPDAKQKRLFDPDIVEKTEAARLRCPKCGGTNIQFVKKGFSLGGAVFGGLLAGGAGLVAGGLGSNDVMCVCSNCGHKWAK
jgi:DNA-directed RNA polymerase subunit RPC12/RpoP/ribosomal protein L7/L12